MSSSPGSPSFVSFGLTLTVTSMGTIFPSLM